MPNNNIKFSKSFKDEVTVISIAKEYPGFEGNDKFILLTDTPEPILKAAYPEEMEWLSPYVICPARMKDIMKEYDANEKKHEWRAKRDADLHAEEIAEGKEYSEPADESFIDRADAHMRDKEWRTGVNHAVRASLEVLGEGQKRRLVMRVHQEMEFAAIAEAEGISKQNVWKSIDRAEARFRKEYDRQIKLLRKNFY